MRPATLLSSALLLAATSSAWPSMFSNPADALKREIAPLLIQRQDDSSTSVASSGDAPKESTASRTSNKESATKTSASSDSTATSDDEDDENENEENDSSSGTAKKTGTQEASETGKETGKDSDDKKTTDKATATNFDPRMPAGGVSMVTPNPLSPESYYKINDNITFAWNYTSLSKAPKYVDVLATCNANQGLYTIAANETFESMQTVVWDTGDYQATGTIPLLTETYTLIIHDAQRDVTATAPAGYLGSWKQFSFKMYETQPYTPLADYVCATCSSAMSLMEKQTYGFLLSMFGLTVLSFGWFAGAAGVL